MFRVDFCEVSHSTTTTGVWHYCPNIIHLFLLSLFFLPVLLRIAQLLEKTKHCVCVRACVHVCVCAQRLNSGSPFSYSSLISCFWQEQVSASPDTRTHKNTHTLLLNTWRERIRLEDLFFALWHLRVWECVCQSASVLDYSTVRRSCAVF